MQSLVLLSFCLGETITIDTPAKIWRMCPEKGPFERRFHLRTINFQEILDISIFQARYRCFFLKKVSQSG